MKVSIFFLCVSAASCTDDASLMQQGVGIENGVLVNSVANQWQARVANVQDALKEVPHQGKMRQMAIDSLMQSVAKKAEGNPDNIDATTMNALNDIIRILNDLLNSFQTQIGVEVGNLATKVQDVANCNAAGLTGDTNAENAATGSGLTPASAQEDHENCRLNEKTLREAVDTACTTIITHIDPFVGSGSAGVAPYSACVTHAGSMPSTKADWEAGDMRYEIPHLFTQNGGDRQQNGGSNIEHNSDHKAAWVSYLSALDSFWDGEKGTWDASASGCSGATGTWAAKVSACDTLQNTHYQKYCLWIQYRHNRCATLATCYPAAETAYNNMKSDHETADDNRIAVTKVVQRVICLVNALKDDSNDLTGFNAATLTQSSEACVIAVGNNDSEIQAAMSRAKPAIDAQDACTDVARPWPQDGATNGDFYSHYSSFASTATTWDGYTPTSYTQHTAGTTDNYDLDLTVATRLTCDPADAGYTYTAVDKKK